MSSEFDPMHLAVNSNTFCVTPWVHQYVGTIGDVKPCCVYEHTIELGNLKNNSLKEIWNNDATKALRLKFLNGEIDSGCEQCFNKNNSTNPRSVFNNTFLYTSLNTDDYVATQKAIKSTLPDGTVPEHNLTYMDVRFNNLCNFSCRTCSPHFSTSWVPDNRKLFNKTFKEEINDGFQFAGKTEEHAFEEMSVHLKDMKEIYFAGGEPMMQKEHYDTLKKLIDLGNTDCRIRYSTNFSRLHLGDDDVIEYWKKFKSIQLLVSIDGSHERGEYWRNGTVWSDIVANRIRVKKEIPKARFHISYTLSWINAHNLVDLHREWIELGYIVPDKITFLPLGGPEQYSLKNIPDWKKQQIEDVFNGQIQWLNDNFSLGAIRHSIACYKDAIEFMWRDPDLDVHESLKRFSRYTKKLDSIRNQDFFKTFPEHEDLNKYMIEHNLHDKFGY